MPTTIDPQRRLPQNAHGLSRSPAGSDSPLSLVIDRREHHHHLDDHHAIKSRTPPPPAFLHESESRDTTSGQASSGFSESPTYSPVRIEVNSDSDQPLSLVVPKKNGLAPGDAIVNYDDSGHDTESTRSSSKSPETKESENGLKIKDFAKFNLGEDAREKIPQHREDTLLAALTAPPKAKTVAFSALPPPPASSVPGSIPAPVVNAAAPNQVASEVLCHHDIDAMSEVSSMSSMSDLIGIRIGDQIQYPCDFCDKIFGNKYHLASHLVTHTGERSFECKFCQKSFGRRSTLRAHLTTHTKTSNFMCPLCEKACNDNNSLEEHIRMHTGEKPFVCTICAKAYARKSHLNVHYRVHTGERPFVCMSCGKDFTEKRFLNDHMQTAHSGNDGPLKCPNCFREFAYKTSLKQHLKKQMCAKNLNRGQNGGGGTSSSLGGSGNVNQGTGVHAKQFACPFCEKSYSWKQTLKQHVSMYHRNKVHTDEFWKYELAKHRRTVLDSKTNEDMWKKQLGKHASEQEAEKAAAAAAAAAAMMGSNSSRSRSLESHDRSKSSESPGRQSRGNTPAPNAGVNAPPPGANSIPNDHWLEQIKRSTTNDPNQNSQVSNEMKLLALHSLQNSLQMMTMKLPMKPPATKSAPACVVVPQETPVAVVQEQDHQELQQPERTKTPCSTPGPQTQGNYLSLLAHLSAQRKADQQNSVSEQNETQQQSRTEERSQSELSSIAPYLSDMKEEPAAKRTQMWLAQLGQYRQKSASASTGFQEEIDRNHEELWEEQIAKVKSHPVKSPLEPIEITIVDQDNDNDLNSGCKAILPPPIVSRPPTPLSPIRQRSPSCNNVISIKTSAIQRMENHPRTFSLSLEVNNNNTDVAAVDHQHGTCGAASAVLGMDLQPRNRHIPIPIMPTSRPPSMNPPPVKRGRLLEIPEDVVPEETSNLNPILNHDAPRAAAVAEEKASTVGTEVAGGEDGSVLKSLLMDRMMSGPRKRTMSEALKPAEPAKRLSMNGESDILRRRLLGIKSEVGPQQENQSQQQQHHQKLHHVQHSIPPKPKFQPPTATVTSQQLQKQVHPVVHLKEPNLVNLDLAASASASAGSSIPNANGMPIDLRKQQIQQQYPAVQQQSQKTNYTQKSVLKHLLYKWEHSGPHTVSATESSSADESLAESAPTIRNSS